jgi:hypothetical protein
LAKISLSKRIDAIKLHPRTLAPLAGPEVNIPFGALVESIGTDHDREKFLFLGEPYSVRREVFLDAIGPDAVAEAPVPVPAAAPATAPVSVESEEPTAPGAKEARLTFERLDAGGYAVARAKVPGGWLVTCGAGMAFYPDPMHEWDGASLE